VNDTLGHAAGDAVLVGAAQRMRAALPKGAIAARLGGDEFAILLPGSDPAEISAIIERTAAAVSEPYEFEGQQAKIGASIGIAFAPLHGTVPEALLVHGDLAMYRAKTDGKGRQCVYNPAMDERRYDRRAAGTFARGTV
jgi:diguanylate cyclase (GGDEF)-like protein